MKLLLRLQFIAGAGTFFVGMIISVHSQMTYDALMIVGIGNMVMSIGSKIFIFKTN